MQTPAPAAHSASHASPRIAPEVGATGTFDVIVPATSANLGPGFDALGMALGLTNTIRVEPSERLVVEIEGEGADELEHGDRNLVYQAVAAVASQIGAPPPAPRLTCRNAIPLARGLGSSSAAIVGGLLAGNRLHGGPLSVGELLDLAIRIEGHPDNVTPALLGGVRVSVAGEAGPVQTAVRLARPLQAVLYVPDFPMQTEAARRLLPEMVSLGDAVFNVGRAALLVAALASGAYDLLREATRDRLHQRPRSALFPAMTTFFAAALDAGAHGAFLSGSGSTLLALVEHEADAVRDAFQATATREGVTGRCLVVAAAADGAQVLP